MARRCFKGGVLALAVVAGLFLGQRVACTGLPAWLGHGTAGSSAPAIRLAHTERDLGTVVQGAELRTAFPIANVGTRRLILREHRRACCGQAADQSEIVVPPGNSTELKVQVDTSPWCGRMREAVRYTTNDPDRPQLTLYVNADVIPCAKHTEKASPDSRDLGFVPP
ncbi:MAG: Ig-like domain-containing protein [Planctomycetota bacterium]|jgi:hypothetical protein